MPSIPKQRRIIDRAALIGKLDAFIADNAPARDMRVDLLRLLDNAMLNGREEVRRRFDAGEANGEQVAESLSFLTDQIVRLIYDFATDHVYPAANPTEGERLCVAAVGGYGRGELAPYSDIDLLFVLPYKETARQEQVIEYILYLLWDLRLRVGHATRSIDECVRLARKDLIIRTAMLESRYLWGDRRLFNELRKRFYVEVADDSGPEFVEEKLAERDLRHEKMGGSRYVLEPNIKEGKGGLRDLHTLYWIAKYLYKVDEVANVVDRGVLNNKESRRFERAHRFLWDVRCNLHFLAGRAEDRLTFDLQPEIAALLGYRDRAGARGVERFMKHYYLIAKEIGDLTRIFCASLEAEHQRKPRFRLPSIGIFQKSVDDFDIDGGRLDFSSDYNLREDPVRILELFRTAQIQELDIHPQALRAITRNLNVIDNIRNDPKANRLFLEMLISDKDPETTLRRLNEAGVFGRFVPDFGRVVAQMQHDMYHVYTVDEHTVFAIGILHGIESGKYSEEMPISSTVVHLVKSRRALYVAVLLHDIAKGRGGDHSELGADVALELCPRLGLTEEETETVEWLVRYHLLFSNTAFRRDISDPQTITYFCSIVQSVERLRLLLVLTAADIRAVGPNVWNAWKAGLLRDLFEAAEERLTSGHSTGGREVRIDHAKANMRRLLRDLPTAAVEAHVARGYPSYWLSFDCDTHAWHARIAHEAESRADGLTIKNRVDEFKAVTEITIYAHDHPGLFSHIAGAMAVSRAQIVDAKIFTMTDGMALDTFWVQDENGRAFDRPDKISRLYGRIEQTLSGQLRPRDELESDTGLPSRTNVFKVAPRVLVDNGASRTHTVIEVNGRDRTGLLYDLTRALSSLNIQIGSAHITTFGESAVDVFYVKDVFGLQITHESKLDQIREHLLAVMMPDQPYQRSIDVVAR
ncbi:MAG: Bifunctional uridylyltransferase/uridylyl-removing enzyme [Alphaproteobacteria bacterium MarineAlpha11_Bin1]|nr:MAG: Bifunctional uridylyltransferase/uridylyl-removing enzyme [Alphaproteobacteria bacterium MarineAlpha11_Bin1]|tara:strand:+ start:2361 stop:5126 length:2766 start_codon:yes stop_codon:yes gene_type:complete